jgi:hypothetical protein
LAGISRAIIGVVNGRDPFAIEVSRIDLAGGKTEARTERSGLAGVEALIVGVADAVREVALAESSVHGSTAAEQAPAPAPSMPQNDGTPADHHVPPLTAAAIPIAPAHPVAERPRSRVLPIVALSAGALGAAALAAAIVTAGVARGTPEGHTRAEAQADLEHRQSYAGITKGLLVAGGLASGVSAFTCVWYFR